MIGLELLKKYRLRKGVVISMDFLLKRGQKCLIRISEKETDAVKIAVANLKADLEKALKVSAEIVALGAQGEEDNEELAELRQ